MCELLWISYVLKNLQLPIITPIPLKCDSQAAIHIVKNPVSHECTKHLSIDCHWLERSLRRVLFLHNMFLLICKLLTFHQTTCCSSIFFPSFQVGTNQFTSASNLRGGEGRGRPVKSYVQLDVCSRIVFSSCDV